MKIWHLRFDGDNYDLLETVKDLPLSEKQTFDGRSKKKEWQPLKVKRMRWKRGLPLSDAPGFMIPVFSKDALEKLYPLICNSVEELELIFSEREYCGVYVTAVLDVIDYRKSKYIMFSDNERIMMFEKYAFKKCKELMNHHIFKIVDEPLRWAFVSDEFKRVVEENELTGFIFELVWDSEESDK